MKNIFAISVEEAQYFAQEKIGRKLTCEELYDVKKMVEFGFELCWEEVLITAIREADKRSFSQRQIEE
ncbi:MAG: hypothetical protein WBB67_11770 [bacterium]